MSVAVRAEDDEFALGTRGGHVEAVAAQEELDLGLR